MAIFKRRAREAKSEPPSVTYTPRFVEMLSVDGVSVSFGTLYRSLAPVRTVVDFLADQVSTTGLKVYRREDSGRPEARDHPLAKLLRNPEPTISARSLIAQTMHDVGVYGNAYWRKLRQSGEVVALTPLLPERVVPRGGDYQAASVYDWTPLGSAGPIQLARDDVVHFRLYDPQDRRVGSSKLEALRPILAEEIEVSRHRRQFWRNAARQDVVILRPASDVEWDEESRSRFREGWQGAMSGTANAGKTAILEDGMDVKPVSFSAKDAEFIEGRRFVLEAVAREYNVPLSLLGLTETATFASQKEFHKQLYQDCLPPWYELIASEIELQLLPEWGDAPGGDIYVEFNVESKLRGSFEEQAAVISTAVGRPWMVVAEARKLQNLPDRGDPSDDELAIPTNNVTLGAPLPPEPAPAQLRVASMATANEAGG